ncbi:secretin N-terminal domain-containing protein [Methylomonas sp. AM2-LC]|uniref:secretin N-terminal domain-containing protein n=1 Tax=Methylomonas sp. AM2-LC TaxID=3153301 RepID=UPI003267770A
MYKFIAFFTACLFLLLPACGERLTALHPSNVENTFPKASSPINKPTTALPPAAVTDALLPNFNQTQLNDRHSHNPGTFNISVHEVEARDFFMSLVVDSQENMVVHPDVAGHISLELKNVNVAQVLNTVQKVYGYDYAKTDIGYVIYPATLQTKIFKIDRLDLQREGSSNTRVSSGQINSSQRNNNNQMSGIGLGTGIGASSGSTTPIGNPNSMSANNSNSGSWITTSSKTDFWDELRQSISAIVDATPIGENSDELHNPKTGTKVVINKQSGIVVVRTQPSQMREVEKLIEQTQNQIGRQVAIEAKILEITLNDSHQNGVNWADIIHTARAAVMSGTLPALGAATAAAAFTIGVKSGDFYAFIELMESQGKTNILSSPRISSLNNQKAVIKVGQDQYFITNVSSNNSVGVTNVVTQDITWTPFFSGIALDVTPQIADSNNITLHIHPSVTRVTNDIKQFTINDQPNEIPMALNVVRESDSVVHAENGQIIVIGGLMQTDIQDNQNGVSMLAGIPYVGNLFRQNSGTGQKSELVILLKPTIINSSNDWDESIERSRQHLQDLEQKKLWK